MAVNALYKFNIPKQYFIQSKRFSLSAQDFNTQNNIYFLLWEVINARA